ncbi:unnamed protein product, partial [Cladocopium goreaui]
EMRLDMLEEHEEQMKKVREEKEAVAECDDYSNKLELGGKGISGQNLLDPIRNQKPSFTSGKRVREKDKLRALDSEIARSEHQKEKEESDETYETMEKDLVNENQKLKRQVGQLEEMTRLLGESNKEVRRAEAWYWLLCMDEEPCGYCACIPQRCFLGEWSQESRQFGLQLLHAFRNNLGRALGGCEGSGSRSKTSETHESHEMPMAKLDFDQLAFQYVEDGFPAVSSEAVLSIPALDASTYQDGTPIVENEVQGFHGTRSSILPTILMQGLRSSKRSHGENGEATEHWRQTESHFEEFVQQWDPSTPEFVEMEVRPFRWVVICKPLLQALSQRFASSPDGSKISLSAGFTFRWCHMAFSRSAVR